MIICSSDFMRFVTFFSLDLRAPNPGDDIRESAEFSEGAIDGDIDNREGS
jgi:hypothetical protein